MVETPAIQRPRRPASGTGAPALIRPCRAEDVRALEWDGAFRAHRRIIEDTFARAERGGARMLVAEVDGFLAGQVWIELERRAIPELWALRVHPAHRGQGLGTRLVRAAEDELARNGADRVRIGVEPENRRAFALYRRLGYRHALDRIDRFGYTDPDHGWIQGALRLHVLEKRLPA